MHDQRRHSTTQEFNRPPRIRPQLPDDAVALPSAPRNQGRQGRSWMSIVPPLLLVGTMLIAYTFISRSTGRSMIFMIPMAAAMVATAGFSAFQIMRERRQNKREESERQQAYQDALEKAQKRLAELEGVQTRVRCFIDPDPATVVGIAGVGAEPTPRRPQPRLWERRSSDPDFLSLRLGIGQQPASIKVDLRHSVEPPPELTALVERYSNIDNVPVTIALTEVGSFGIAGPQALRMRLAHMLLWNVMVHHAPSDVRVAAIYEANQPHWSWLRWPPHSVPLNGDTQRMMLATDIQRAEDLLVELLDELSRRREHGTDKQSNKEPFLPHVVLVIDRYTTMHRQPAIKEIIRQGREYGMSALILMDRWDAIPGDCGALVDVASDGAVRYALAGNQWSQPLRMDQADMRQSEVLGRALAAIARAEGGGDQDVPRTVRLLNLLGVGDAEELVPPMRWAEQPKGAWHADVPIGQAAGGELVCLDLREHHHGPHGIIAGATGSGKSELLQAIIASVAITHAPDRAHLLLIDFKGGASLRVFKDLPHTVGLVTDLQGRLAERAIVTIKSEIRRRKELLNSIDVKDITAYRALTDPPEPLANLLIVIDEFDEMVKEQPDFVTELIRVVKQGRSLGVHLLLATQQPSRSVKDDIKSQLQYWISLRLGTAEDSREMLQRTDAFFLPTGIPGRGYFRVGTALTLFQAARITNTYRARSDQTDKPAIYKIDHVGQVRLLDGPQIHERIAAASADDAPNRTDLEVVVTQLEIAGIPYRASHRSIWCPPLASRITLERMLAPRLVEAVHEERWWSIEPDDGWLRPPIGLLDIPQESRQEPLECDLTSGHILIVGAPSSGKTVMLRTLLMSLALSHTPTDVWCYAVDAGGQGLNPFRAMPHVGGLVQVRDIEQVRRMLWLINRTLKERQELFRSANAADLATYRSETGQQLAAIVLIIDKFALFREEHEDLIDDLIGLARVGRAYGIHLIITADRPVDIPYRLLGLLDSRFILRIADESDAVTLTSKRFAAQIPANLPGRGYRLVSEQGWLEFQVALPHLERGTVEISEGDEAVSSLLDTEINANARRLMEQLQAVWQAQPESDHRSAPTVRLLPEVVCFDQILPDTTTPAAPIEEHDAGLDVLVGFESQTIDIARVPLNPQLPALLVVGGPRSGKTTALRTMLLSLVQRYSPEELGLVLVDPRNGSFRDLRTLPHVEHYAASEQELAAITPQLYDVLDQGSGNKKRIVCIDDYELGASLMSSQFSKPYGASANKTFMMALEAVTTLGRDQGFSLLVSTASSLISTGLLSQINAGRSGLIMRPNDYQPGTNILGVKLPIKIPGTTPPSGRGILVLNGVQQWVQVALAGQRHVKQVIEENEVYAINNGADHSLHSTLA